MGRFKFRGQCIYKKEWIFGYYANFTPSTDLDRLGDDWIITGFEDEMFQVIPETVGQFTGMLDVDGIELYEGDVVTAALMHHGKPGTPFKASIIYNNHIGSFRIAYDSLGGGSQDEIYFRYQIKIIGNIHQNK